MWILIFHLNTIEMWIPEALEAELILQLMGGSDGFLDFVALLQIQQISPSTSTYAREGFQKGRYLNFPKASDFMEHVVQRLRTMASTEPLGAQIQWGLHWMEDEEDIEQIVWEVYRHSSVHHYILTVFKITDHIQTKIVDRLLRDFPQPLRNFQVFLFKSRLITRCELMHNNSVFFCSHLSLTQPCLFNGVLIQANHVPSSKLCSKWQWIMLAGG